ncbi:hypothetical protein E2562_011453 [Oryza meyeriana var. granulata]|uniref:Uncharacterized protein n=1 Tax=Oryza meyeriana var. granulata TaxID=110450 RepID=A0A6G1D195_9ORYZ|nr:hypothetical protein E2562_011453 [Oryza meyeriana var. granulata]
MHTLSGLRSLAEGFRSLLASNSTAMEAVKSMPSSDTAEEFIKQHSEMKTDLEMGHTKVRTITEQISVLEGELQEIMNKLKVNQTGDSKLWQLLELKVSSTKTLFYQLTESLQLLGSLTVQVWKPTIGLELESLERISFRPFHTTASKNMGKRKRMQHKDSKEESWPGNTAKIVLDLQNLPASKGSYKRGIKKVRAWCRANSNLVNLSKLFGPGAEVSPTPSKGTFHLTFEHEERQLTLIIYGRDLYLKGWNGDRFGLFAAHPSQMDKKNCFIKDPSCRILNIAENYNRLVPRGQIGNIRIGPLAMVDYFHVLHKCNRVVTADVLKAFAGFGINVSEPIRLEDIFLEILDAFDQFDLDRLDRRRPLSFWCRNYSHYSQEYLQGVDCFLSGKPLPAIVNHGGGTVKSLHELHHQIKVPSRDSYNSGVFLHEPPELAIWSPPYADGRYWVSEEEMEEKEEERTSEEEEEEMEEEVEEEVRLDYPGRLNCMSQGFSSAVPASVRMSASDGMTASSLYRPFVAAASGRMSASDGMSASSLFRPFAAVASGWMRTSGGMITRATTQYQCNPPADQSGLLCRALQFLRCRNGLKAIPLLKWLPR